MTSEENVAYVNRIYRILNGRIMALDEKFGKLMEYAHTCFADNDRENQNDEYSKKEGDNMAVTFTLPDYSELEERLREHEERLDRIDIINQKLSQLKDLQYQNDGIRKHINKLIGLSNAMEFRVRCLESGEDCEDNDESEEDECDESTPTDQLIDKLDEFIEAMATLKDVLKRVQ